MGNLELSIIRSVRYQSMKNAEGELKGALLNYKSSTGNFNVMNEWSNIQEEWKWMKEMLNPPNPKNLAIDCNKFKYIYSSTFSHELKGALLNYKSSTGNFKFNWKL